MSRCLVYRILSTEEPRVLGESARAVIIRLICPNVAVTTNYFVFQNFGINIHETAAA